jgi:hypothetical protein
LAIVSDIAEKSSMIQNCYKPWSRKVFVARAVRRSSSTLSHPLQETLVKKVHEFSSFWVDGEIQCAYLIQGVDVKYAIDSRLIGNVF